MMIGGVARYLDVHSEDDKYWHSLCTRETSRPKFPMLFHVQVLVIIFCPIDLVVKDIA